jgi:hypothetical protein
MAIGWLGVYPILLPVATWVAATGFGVRPEKYCLRLIAPLLSALVSALLGLRLYSLLSPETPPWGRIAIVALVVLVTYSFAQLFLGRASKRIGVRNGVGPAG